MFHELVSRNDDVKRLVEKGYAIKGVVPRAVEI